MNPRVRKLQQQFSYRPTVVVPMVREVDAELFKLVKKKIKRKKLKWREVFTEMALLWLRE